MENLKHAKLMSKSFRYFINNYYRLPLPEEDYHEFIVKSEKKQKQNFKKKFAFFK